MIPIIRSLLELRAISESRNCINNDINNNDLDSQKNNHKNSEVELPHLPRLIRNKWTRNKKIISRFFDEIDYNSEIQSTFDLTLIERQSKRTHQDVA